MADAVGTTHHVKVGDDFLLLRQGMYRKRGAPLFGARFTTGDPDYNNMSFWQHWAQSCWVGGMGADSWTDDAMFDRGVGLDIATHEVAVLARDLGRPAGKGWELSTPTVKFDKEFAEFNKKLYCLEKSTVSSAKLWRYTPGTDTWAQVSGAFPQREYAMCNFSGKLWFSDVDNYISYMDPDESIHLNAYAKPTGRTETPWVMKEYKGKMYMAFGRYLWRMNYDEKWDGNVVFADMPGVDNIVAMELHQGFLYLASYNGHILRTDGNITLDLWQWDGGTYPTSLRSFDGKLFVSCNEPTLSGTGTEGVLYQFTGSAVTELKRWGEVGLHCNVGKMRVARRHLIYGASNLLGIGYGFGVAVYDAAEDSHSVYACNRDGVTYAPGANGIDNLVDDSIYWGGWLFTAVRGHGLFKTQVSFRDASQYLATYDTSAVGAGLGSKNGGWMESSDFDAGTPGLMKLWRRAVIHIDLPNNKTGYTFEYSLDGGTTWKVHGNYAGDGRTVRRTDELYFNSLEGTRFKWRITLRTSDAMYTPALRSVIVSYLPQGDPNWQWEMQAVLSQEVELLDGTKRTQDVAGIIHRLEGMYRQQRLVYFTDVDGQRWSSTRPGVLITDFQKDLRYIGPGSDGPLEGDVRLTLIEGVEQTQ